MTEPSRPSHGPARILLVSTRRACPDISRSLTFEFEDVIASVDHVDVVTPRTWSLRKTWRYRLDQHFPALSIRLPRTAPPRRKPYELVVFVCQSLLDLAHSVPVDALRRAGSRSVLYVEELWRHGLTERRGELRWVRRFDHVFLCCEGTVRTLHELTGVPVDYVAPAVDMSRWADRRPEAPRGVDIHWFGRRNQQIHEKLKAYAKRAERFYLYDTAIRSDPEDMADHRDQFRSRLTATKIAIVLPAKINLGHEIRDQQEVGFRFFECLAAGTVLVGEPPRTIVAGDLLGWRDAVVPVDPARGLERTLDDLLADDPRRASISARNTWESLRRHDVSHRWAWMLDRLGMSSLPELDRRLAALETAAERFAGAGVAPAD